MRYAPITVGLTLALSLAACSGPVTLASAPEEEKTDETLQLVHNEEGGTEEVASVTDDTTAAGNTTAEATTEPATENDVAISDEEKRVSATGASEESASMTNTIADIVASGSVLFANPEWPRCEATEGIPVPIFSVPVKSASMNEDGYSCGADATWQGVSEAEVVTYLEALRDAGFVYNTSLSRSSDSFSYSAGDTNSYTGTRRTINLNYHLPYDEEENALGYVLDISIWLTRDDPDMSAYAYSDGLYSEDVIVD